MEDQHRRGLSLTWCVQFISCWGRLIDPQYRDWLSILLRVISSYSQMRRIAATLLSAPTARFFLEIEFPKEGAPGPNGESIWQMGAC